MPGRLDDLAAMLPAGSVSTEPADLRAHARDWWPLAMLRERRGDRPELPLAVVRPAGTEDVAAVVRWADETGTPVVPFGGGSGVCGGAGAVAGAVSLDLRRMDRVLDVDTTALVVRAQAGVMGPALEGALGARGLTLGHFPQSIDISTLGGWLSARGAGQKSSRYGRVEEMLLGLEVVLPVGRVLRTRPAPRAELRPAVMRLYDEADAAIAFRHAGERPAGAPLVLRFEGGELAGEEEAAVRRLVEGAGGRDVGPALAEDWWRHRNAAVESLRKVMFEGMLGPTAVADTMEVAALWPDVPAMYEAVRGALGAQADVVGCHASHVYPQGTCLYFTFLILGSADDAVAEERYHAAWAAGMEAALASGATTSHHHGVGLLKAPWAAREWGEGLEVLRAVKRALDPNRIMNPGKLGL